MWTAKLDYILRMLHTIFFIEKRPPTESSKLTSANE